MTADQFPALTALSILVIAASINFPAANRVSAENRIVTVPQREISSRCFFDRF
jgi:hypothetical protein